MPFGVSRQKLTMASPNGTLVLCKNSCTIKTSKTSGWKPLLLCLSVQELLQMLILFLFQPLGSMKLGCLF